MDIIIRNGVIQQNENERINNIMNDEGLLKKDFKKYVKGISGPYYDLAHSHICIPRKYNMIPNFIGPQDKTKIKLINTNNFNKKTNYCIICHEEMKQNVAFSSKRKQFYEENIFARKIDPLFELEQQFKKVKLEKCEKLEKSEKSEKSVNIKTINDLHTDRIKLSVNNNNNNNNNSWILFFYKIYKSKLHNYNMQKEYDNYKYNQEKIVNKYYKMVYKLIKKPILYPISIKETKLLYPWELTNYQKFKLNNPDYKSNPIFSLRSNYNITNNYVVIY